MSDQLTSKIIGAAIEVHKHLGAGFLESIYEEALCCELGMRGVLFERQKSVDVLYKGIVIKGQRIDLVVANEVVVEIKAASIIAPAFVAQTLSYLASTGIKRGLLINFGEKRLVDGIKRLSL